jgi:ADP-heptose:LPS heptosyltransferase
MAHPGHSFALLGGSADTDVATHIKGESQNSHTKSFCDAPFAQTAALIRDADLYLGVDSGLTHVAGVLGVRSVVIGNLSNPTWLPRYNPYAVILTESKNCVCSGDRNKDCFYEVNGERFFRCMLDVTDEQIESAISQSLS